jgi:hypothetical protein
VTDRVAIRESDIQKVIMDWLTLHRIFHYRNNAGGMSGKHKGKPWFVKFGKVGMPDIVAVFKGRYIGIEVKGPKGFQSRVQTEFQVELEKAGGIYILARSIEDVQKAFVGLWW